MNKDLYKLPDDISLPEIPQQQRVGDLFGMFQTVSVAPAATEVPRTMIDQIKIYVNGATLRLYWYDTKANAWHYVTATA